MENQPEQDTIEAQLRATAPPLAPELRTVVLLRCQEAHRRRPFLAWQTLWSGASTIWRKQWRLAGALMGFLILCGVANNWLDTQNQTIISGKDSRQVGFMTGFNNQSLAQMRARNQYLFAALRWRLHQMALLLREKHSG